MKLDPALFKAIAQTEAFSPTILAITISNSNS
jgi:hypothetical protein